MPIFNHRPSANWFKKLFSKGANRDVRPEFLPDGIFYDAQNMRPSSVLGNTGAVERIKGELILYTSTDPNQNSYTCIGPVSTNGHVVSFWASSVAGQAPVVVVDGVVMAQSALIPYTYDRPLQFGIQEKCNSGVIFPADGENDPLFWDIQSLIDNFNSNSGYYFGAFDPATVSVGLNAPANWPVLNKDNALQGLVDLGGSAGNPVGTYGYYQAYETANGDRTNWGLRSPQIAVPEYVVPNTTPTSRYPGGRTHGGETSILTPTRYGIEMKLRVDNKVGYSTLVLARHRVNDGIGIDNPGVDEIIARIPISPGQNNIITFVDPPDSNVLEIIPSDVAAVTQFAVHAPKAVTYANGRLIYFNMKGVSQALALTWRAVSGKLMVPITRKLTRIVGGVEVPNGYDSAYNSAYNTKAIGGDKYGIGVQTWDGLLGKGFAQDIPGLEAVQFPNRRDIKADDSLAYSDDPCWAANVNTQGPDQVTATFEAMTQGSAKKTDVASVVNVNTFQGSVYRPLSDYISQTTDPAPNTDITALVIGGVPVVSPSGERSYQPWQPQTNGTESSSGYNISPIALRILAPNDVRPDTGNIFAPTYHALGACIYGPETLPASVRAFTMLHTKRAKRVITQGAATYWLGPGGVPTDPSSKKTNGVTFFSPDMAKGAVDQSTMDDMRQNPQNYSLEFVSPLGFYTEQYASYPTDGTMDDPANRGQSTDMISYMRVMWDQGQANVGDDVPHGVQPSGTAPHGNYTSWAKWRSSNASGSFWSQGANNGNSQLQMANFEPVTEGRGNYWHITTDQYIYPADTQNIAAANAYFNDPVMRRWHQPWYIVNIVRNGQDVPAENSTTYQSSGTNIAVDSCIGISTGATQDYELLCERIEDVLPYFNTEFRYVYVSSPGQPVRIYACVTNQAYITANLASVQADIAGGGWVSPDGKTVTGLYEVIDGKVRIGTYGYIPPVNSRVNVRYVPGEAGPIRMFGFGATIGPSVFAQYDRTGSGDDYSSCMTTNGLPLPFRGYSQNPRYFMPNGGSETQQRLGVGRTDSIRQWVIMFDCETDLPLAMNVNATSLTNDRRDESQFFPAIHYIIRPMHGLPFSSGADAGFNAQYDIDYPNESVIFNKGGLRFLPDTNFDYAAPPGGVYKGFPKSGYTENLDLCTVGIASQEYDPLKNNAPGLRTFLDADLKAISDDQGEVKLISSGLGQYGQNLYLWTQSGLCRILTNKNVLTGADSTTIGLLDVDNYWGDETWIKRNAMGLPDQFWRMWSRGVAPGGGGYTDQFFWFDRKGAYRLAGDGVDDISKGKYQSVLLPILKALPADYSRQMSAVWNNVNNEMWASIAPVEGRTPKPGYLFVYSGMTNEWLGQYTYRFDEYLCHDGEVLGFRDLETYTMDTGEIISGKQLSGWAHTPVVGEVGKYKEAVRARIIGTKPDALALYNKDGILIGYADEATYGPDWIKRYDSWETFFGPLSTTDDADTWFLQDEYFFVRVIYNTPGQKEMTGLEVQLRNVK